VASKDGRGRKAVEIAWSPEVIRNIAEFKYRLDLGKDLAVMLEKDGDGGVKLRERAGSYDRLAVAWLKAGTTQRVGDIFRGMEDAAPAPAGSLPWDGEAA